MEWRLLRHQLRAATPVGCDRQVADATKQASANTSELDLDQPEVDQIVTWAKPIIDRIVRDGRQFAEATSRRCFVTNSVKDCRRRLKSKYGSE